MKTVLLLLQCIIGDVGIALGTLVIALLLVKDGNWPARSYAPVGALAIALGLAVTVLIEWLNVAILKTWAYSELMPVIPLVDAGLSPVAQWLIVPLAGLWWASRVYPDGHLHRRCGYSAHSTACTIVEKTDR